MRPAGRMFDMTGVDDNSTQISQTCFWREIECIGKKSLICILNIPYLCLIKISL
jgi:hypothetical protein